MVGAVINEFDEEFSLPAYKSGSDVAGASGENNQKSGKTGQLKGLEGRIYDMESRLNKVETIIEKGRELFSAIPGSGKSKN